MDRDRLHQHYNNWFQWLRDEPLKNLESVLNQARNQFRQEHPQISAPKPPECEIKEFSQAVAKAERSPETWQHTDMFRREPDNTVTVIVNDLVRGRLVCATPDDVDRTVDILKRFNAIEIRYDEPKHEQSSGYRAYHIYALLRVVLEGHPVRFPVEIQVKTLLQDAWANFGHDEFYKTEHDVPRVSTEISRRLADALDAIDHIGQAVRNERFTKRSGPLILNDDETLITPRTLRYLVNQKFREGLNDVELDRCIDQLKAFGYESCADVGNMLDEPRVSEIIESVKAEARIPGKLTPFEVVFFGPLAVREERNPLRQALSRHYGHTGKMCAECGAPITEKQQAHIDENTDLDSRYLCKPCCESLLQSCTQCGKKLTEASICKECQAASDAKAII